MAGKKVKSERQVRFLLSKGSPLSDTQKTKLKKELHSGAVSIKKKKSNRDSRGVRKLG